MTYSLTEFKARIEGTPELQSFFERLEFLAAELGNGDDSLRLQETERAIEWLDGLRQRRSSWREIVTAMLTECGTEAVSDDGTDVFDVVDRALGLTLHALLSLRGSTGTSEDVLVLSWLGDEPRDASCHWRSTPGRTLSLCATVRDALDAQEVSTIDTANASQAIVHAVHAGHLPLRGLTSLDDQAEEWSYRRRGFSFEDQGPAYKLGTRVPESATPSAVVDEAAEFEEHVGMSLLADVVTCRIEIITERDKKRRELDALAGTKRLVAACIDSPTLDASIVGTRFDESLSATNFDFVTNAVVSMTGRSIDDVHTALGEIGIQRAV